MTRKETAKSAWNDRALSWDQRSMNMWERGSRKDIVDFIVKHITKNSTVIDIGCGSGYGTYKLHKAGYHVTGIDLSEKMIQLANKQFANESICFLQCDIDEFAIKNKQYGGIMAINVLEWLENPASTLSVLKDILIQGGYLCAGILGPTAGPRANSFRRLYGEEVIMNTMMPWEFVQLATENGFTLVDHYGVYKKEVNESNIHHLPLKLQQALSFMWIFMMKKQGS